MSYFDGEHPFIELSREDMLKVKFSRALLPIIYNYLVPKIKEKWGLEQGIERLKDFGRKLMNDILSYWIPRGKTVPEVIQKVYEFIFYRKLDDVKEFKNEKPRRWIVYDKKCPLCWEGTEVPEIHFCVALAGAIESLLNKLHELGYKNIPKAVVNTLTSKARGDPICSHEIIEVL
jgi:CRISPR/Cas system-associated protein Cas10 (large subunit of type III CRISPR-Cas system)